MMGRQVNSERTALMLACEHGLTDCVHALLRDRRQCDVNAVDRYGCTALIVACNGGYEGCVRALLGVRGREVNINAADEYGLTSLMHACDRGHEGCVRLLLGDQRCYINAVNEFGMTALILACHGGHEGCVRALLCSPTKCHVNPEEIVDLVVNKSAALKAVVECGVVDGYPKLIHKVASTACAKRYYNTVRACVLRYDLDVGFDRNGHLRKAFAGCDHEMLEVLLKACRARKKKDEVRRLVAHVMDRHGVPDELRREIFVLAGLVAAETLTSTLGRRRPTQHNVYEERELTDEMEESE